MKKKLLVELEEFKIENLSLFGGAASNPYNTGTENCETCDGNTRKSDLPGDYDCDRDTDAPLIAVSFF